MPNTLNTLDSQQKPHLSVMLQESLQYLQIDPDGIYIDGTFGRGGHSMAILQQLSSRGRLISFDQDPDAVSWAKNTIKDERFSIIHDNFVHHQQHLLNMGIQSVNGILLDLGLCSTQIDQINRGFSFMNNAPLDMRMNNTNGATAAQWLNSASANEISEVLWFYGEEKFSRKIAQAIYNARGTINTTHDLANLVKATIPYRDKHKHPATRTFQAIRIFINDELTVLDQMMQSAPLSLTQQGRLVVISFHSLEDRIVKRKFLDWSKSAEYSIIVKKLRPSAVEVSNNTRSRSAIMRCLEKTNILEKTI